MCRKKQSFFPIKLICTPKQISLEQKIPIFTNLAKSEHFFFPLGEITKCKRVNRKTCEESSSSEESEAGEDNDADDSDEQSESDDRGKHGQDLHKQTSKKYGKGMVVFFFIFS